MATKKPVAPPDPGPPPYYIATEALCVDGNPFQRAHNTGDRVPAEHVVRHGWADKVRPPDGYAAPEPTSEPETPTGQATTDEKGEA